MTKQTVRAIVRNSKDQILLIERHKQNKHYFVLPGGHVDEGESLEQALVREVLEETSLEVKIDRLVKSETDELGNIQHIYQCKNKDGSPILGEDTIEYELMNSGQQSWQPKWFDLQELKNKTIYPEWLLKEILLI